MFLFSRRSVSSAGRSTVLRLWYMCSQTPQRLRLGFQRSKGRASSSGRRLVLSKGSNANRNVYCCMGSLNLLFVAALVVEYRRTPRGSGGVRALLCTALGC